MLSNEAVLNDFKSKTGISENLEVLEVATLGAFDEAYSEEQAKELLFKEGDLVDSYFLGDSTGEVKYSVETREGNEGIITIHKYIIGQPPVVIWKFI